MKKLIFAMLALLMVSCSKESQSGYPLEGIQWITAEIESEDGNYYTIWDIGKTEPGTLYTMTLYTEDSRLHKAGELVVEAPTTYKYNSKTGIFTVEGFISVSMAVSFMDQNTIVMDLLGQKTVYTASTKYYNPKKGSEDEGESAGFAITSDKNEDWAGGTIKFSANEQVASWDCEVLYPNNDSNNFGHSGNNGVIKVSDNGELLLRRHWKFTGGDQQYDNLDMDIKVTATSTSGKKASKIVKSKYWQPEIYEMVDGNIIGERIYPTSLYGGEEICVALFDAEDNFISNWFEANSGWVDESTCLARFGTMGTYICVEVLTKDKMKDPGATPRLRIVYGAEIQDIDFTRIK